MPSTRPKPEERDYSSKRKPSYKEKSWNNKPIRDDKPREELLQTYNSPPGTVLDGASLLDGRYR